MELLTVVWSAAAAVAIYYAFVAKYVTPLESRTDDVTKTALAKAGKGFNEAIVEAEARFDAFDAEFKKVGNKAYKDDTADGRLSNPNLSPLQRETARQNRAKMLAGNTDFAAPKRALVTGGTGFVGARLVEMLVERGAERVVAFDVVPPLETAWKHPAIEYVVGDISDPVAVDNAARDVDVVFHLAAAVGPFHSDLVYNKVNIIGTRNVLAACKKHGIKKLVMSSSPSTRFDGSNVDGLTVDQLPKLPQKKYLVGYAETKAVSEKEVLDACTDDFFTVAVAPHQVFGPRDVLFLNSFLEAAALGRLRPFSAQRSNYGLARICFSFVDNYAHGLLLGERRLGPKSPVLGKFYITTDAATHPFSEGYQYLWVTLDQMCKYVLNYPLTNRYMVPEWIMWPMGKVSDLYTAATGKHFKIKTFSVLMLVMHRWFNIDDAERDLKYVPIVNHVEGVAETSVWFKRFFIPKLLASAQGGWTGVEKSTEKRLSVHEAAAHRSKKD